MVTGVAIYGDELLWSTWMGDSSDLWLRTGDGTVTRQRESGVMNLQGVGHRDIFTEGDSLMGGEWSFESCSLQAVTRTSTRPPARWNCTAST